MSGTLPLAQLLPRALEALAREQLPTGEIPTYFRSGNGLQYRRSPLLSALAHDALACFDPASPWCETEALERIAPRSRQRFVHLVRVIRRGIRSFLAWEEQCDGTWRFFGRASGVPADADTTACAAAVLLDKPARDLRQRWRRHSEALARLRSPAGIFPGGLPPRPEDGFDRVGNAHALRFLTLTGGEAGGLAEVLLREAEKGEPGDGKGRYPGPLGFAWALARTWSQARLPGRQALAGVLLPRLLAREDGAGDFGGPLSTALALSALLDLGYAGPETERARTSLSGRIRPTGTWPYESFLAEGGGSPSWTTALSLAALARADAALGGDAP